jgi:Helix-turn-helix domain
MPDAAPSLTAPAPILVDETTTRRLLGNVSAKSLFNWRRNGSLPFVKLGTRTMYRPEDLAEFVERRRQRGGGQ